jgi:DNA-directed RNA polymerase specialized sigma24 family protein
MPIEEMTAYGVIERACKGASRTWDLDTLGLEIGDLVGEVWTRYQENMGEIRAEDERSLGGWAKIVARNCLNDLDAKRKSHKTDQFPVRRDSSGEPSGEPLEPKPLKKRTLERTLDGWKDPPKSPEEILIEKQRIERASQCLLSQLKGMTLGTCVLFLLVFLPKYWLDSPHLKQHALEKIAASEFSDGAGLAGLSSRDQEVLLDRYASEYEDKESLPVKLVSELTGIREDAIYVRISRERAKLMT